MKRCLHLDKMAVVVLLTIWSSCVFMAQAQSANPLYDKGYQGYADVSVGYIPTNNGLQTSLLTSHGYSTGFGLYTGLGTGIELAADHNYPESYYLSFPLFMDLKYSFLNSDFSPYAGLRTGMNLNWGTMKGGVYISPSVGVDIRKHFSFFLKYDYQTTSEYNYVSSSKEYHWLKFRKHAFSVGISVGF